MAKTVFGGRVVFLGFGSVAQCTLPIVIRHLDMPASKITVIDFADYGAKEKPYRDMGVNFVRVRIDADNLASELGKHLGSGDLLIDLSWNIDAVTILDWCHQNNVRYINTSVEEWDAYTGAEAKHPHDRALYARQMKLRKLKAKWRAEGTFPGASQLVDHGANPGWVNHFVKRGLLEIGEKMLERGIAPEVGDKKEFESRLAAAHASEETGIFARLAQAVGLKVVHISERDTQISDQPKRMNEFVNTWSIEGFYEEGIAPAELSWGTHERRLPRNAAVPFGGPQNQIFLAQPGVDTWVRSWVPLGGEIHGMVVRHAEAFTIGDSLTVWEEAEKEVRRPLYRPTVHYAYHPCDAAIISLHELKMRNLVMQPELRIMQDEIIEGRDELGVLLMGHGLTSYWVGSQLDIHEARKIVPGQNATTLQVAAAVIGGVLWMIDNPEKGLLVPDELPHKEILKNAYLYLGNCPSVETDWTPLRDRNRLWDTFGNPRPREDEMWQFTTFQVNP